MAETTADVRRDIELTRERMSDTLDQLEAKLNVSRFVRDNPWPALALAFGAGLVLSGSRADVKAAAASVAATRGASSRLAPMLDDVVAQFVTAVREGFETRVEQLVGEVKQAIGAPAGGSTRSSNLYESGPTGGASGYGAGVTSPAGGASGSGFGASSSAGASAGMGAGRENVHTGLHPHGVTAHTPTTDTNPGFGGAQRAD